MTALPADIGKYTVDGVVVSSPDLATSNALKALHANARTTNPEYDTFFDNYLDAQAMLDEKASYLTEANQAHLAIQIEDDIDIGGVLPIAPVVPCFLVVDDANNLSRLTRVRSVAHDFDTDSYAVEVYG